MNIAVFRITYIREKENNRLFRSGIAEDDPSFQKTISEYIERYQKEKNIDIIKDIAPLITDKKEIYAVYTYLANFYISSKNPYKKDILKMMESDLAGRLTQQEIDRVFRRK